jgi:hypothetical protein
MDDYDVRESDPRMLARMLDLQSNREGLWEPGELGQILEHQLAASVESDLLGADQGLAEQLRLKCTVEPPIETFKDLLHHPAPPIELLERTKQYAKASRGHSESPLPDEVASVLYLLSIVVALAKCGRRITKLSDDRLRLSLDWALGQSWLDASTRSLLKQGRQAVQPKPQ